MIPESVKKSITAIWAMIGISAIAALIDRLTGSMPSGEFVFSLIFYGIMVVFPYKLSKASNPTRYVWAVISVIGVMLMIGEPNSAHGKMSLLVSYATVPVGILTLVWLFSEESNRWFSKTV